jgi:hypothetical protein
MRNLFISLTILITLFSCFYNKEPDKAQPEKANFIWFVIEKGKFKNIENIEALPTVKLQPWTIQERISDIVIASGKIIIGINGYGIAFLDPKNVFNSGFRYHFDPSLFTDKTFTTIIPFEDKILCHFYFNVSLSQNLPIELTDGAYNFAFLSLNDKEAHYIPLILPSQKETHNREAVGYLPVNKTEWYIEWKQALKTAVTFDYSDYDLNNHNETVISRQNFRSAYRFTDINDSSVPVGIKKIAETITKKTNCNKNTTTFHFIVKNSDTNITERYILQANVDINSNEYEIENILLCRMESQIYGLCNQESVLCANINSEKVRELLLPSLHNELSYTGLIVYKNKLFLPWEQTQFFNTGNSGLLVVDKISN